MTDLDPQLRATLDRLVSVPREAGDWARVVADAGSADRRRRPVLAFAAAAILTAALAVAAGATPAFVSGLADDSYRWLFEFGPKPTTPVVTVTYITDRSGLWWTLTAYQSEHKGLCFQLTSEPRTGSGLCRASEPIDVMVMKAEPPSGTFVAGPVTSDAARVQISGAAEQVDAKVVTAPAGLDMDTKFYVAELPPGLGAPQKVSALDAQGDVIASRSIPPEDR